MESLNLNSAPYSIDADEVLSSLQTDLSTGLSSSEARIRNKKFGSNKIKELKRKSRWLVFLSQFNNLIVGLLLFATGLSFYFSEWMDGTAILIVIFINVFIGFYMENQAIQSMKALKKLSAIPAKVLRDGKTEEINAEEVVPGDIIYIETGDIIPADGRIVKASQLQIDESSLTGESIPVEKETPKISPETVLGERKNMLYKGTFSTKGNAYFVTTAIGMKTELGKIAHMVQLSGKTATPLEKKLESFSKTLIWITLLFTVLIFIVGLLNGKKWFEMLETSVALAVAAIPEGLPIVATITLAKGMIKMARHNVIVRKLSSVETLGGTNIICTDKTGTLTQNKIEVSRIITPANNDDAFRIMNQIAILCNTAILQKKDECVIEIGDPLEIGLLNFSEKNNYSSQIIRNSFPKVREEPFSSETKIMSTLHQNENNFTVFAKGASEELLLRCSRILEKDGIKSLDEEKRNYWIKRADDIACSGLRVIAAAYHPFVSEDVSITNDFVFVGIFGMIDPPREDIFSAIKECKTAGINVVMVTGDHPATAKKIALDIGICEEKNANVISGNEMKNYSSLSERDKKIWMETKVFARVSPKQKFDLVALYQEKGNIVGMTGDGVNDAPALKKADIGIAMGKKGTQVSQEASDMVLKDDSFSSIVIAIRQGRIIFENIRKFVVFLLSCNLSEIMVVASLAIVDAHFQLFPLQILFINLVTDTLPALALGVTEGNEQIMKKPPRNLREPIINKKNWLLIFIYAFIIGTISIGAVIVSHFAIHKTVSWNFELCNNILFFTLILSQLLHVFNMSNGFLNFFKTEVIKNKYVWGAIIISAIILILAYNIPFVSNALSLYQLSIYDWLIIAVAGLLSMIINRFISKINFLQT